MVLLLPWVVVGMYLGPCNDAGWMDGWLLVGCLDEWWRLRMDECWQPVECGQAAVAIYCSVRASCRDGSRRSLQCWSFVR